MVGRRFPYVGKAGRLYPVSSVIPIMSGRFSCKCFHPIWAPLISDLREATNGVLGRSYVEAGIFLRRVSVRPPKRVIFRK